VRPEYERNSPRMSSNSYVNLKIATCLVRYADDRLIDQRFPSFSEYTPDAASSFRVAEKYVNVGTFGRWQLNPAFYAITAYNYTASSGDSSARYHQVNFGLDYLLSKRTDLYVSTAYQHASGRNGLGAAQAVIGSNDVNSGASSQVLVDIGMRHRF
ncbi:porin, partial [Burkholderia multivorans]|uniref:porin n=1 Tax=Burkholderia multivorans TaxID=87883 RepID=UPI001C231551